MRDNSQDNRRIAKNTMLLYLRSVLLMLISLYTSRVVLKSLGVDDYGIYNVVGGVVVMFQMLSTTLAAASQRFITYALGKGEPEHLRQVFSTSITLHVCLGIILVVLIEIVGTWLLYNELKIPSNRLDMAFIVLQFSLLTLFVNVISVPFNAAIIAHERMNAFSYISILEGGMKLGVAFILLGTSIDRLGLYAFLMFMIAVTLRFIYSIYSHRHFAETRNVRFRIVPQLFKEMFAFSSWNLLGNASKALRNQGVDILLNMQFGVGVNAAKGIANQVDNAVYQFVGNFQTAVSPQITKSIASNDFERCYTLVCNASRYSFLLLSIFAVPLIMTIDTVLSLWLSQVPDWSAAFIRLMMIYLLCDTMSRLLINSLLANGKIRNYQLIVAGTKFLAIPLCYLVLKLGGSPSTGICVNIFLELICIWERLYFNKKYINFPILDYVKGVMLRCWFTFGLALAVPLIMLCFVSDNFFVIFSISVFYTVIIVCLVGINKSERCLVWKQIMNRIRK